MSILVSEYIAPNRPYSQEELRETRYKLYKKIKIGKTKAWHDNCKHFYYVKKNGRKEKDILNKNENGNCSVCWKLKNIDKNQKEQAINMIECYSNLFYNEPEFVSYKLVDLETVFYTWLYEENK